MLTLKRKVKGEPELSRPSWQKGAKSPASLDRGQQQCEHEDHAKYVEEFELWCKGSWELMEDITAGMVIDRASRSSQGDNIHRHVTSMEWNFLSYRNMPILCLSCLIHPLNAACFDCMLLEEVNMLHFASYITQPYLSMVHWWTSPMSLAANPKLSLRPFKNDLNLNTFPQGVVCTLECASMH